MGGQVAVPGVAYMMRMTNQDRQVTPFTAGLLNEETKYVVFGDICPSRLLFPTHFTIMFSRVCLLSSTLSFAPGDARPTLDCEFS